MSRRQGRRIERAPVVVALAALVVGGVVLDRTAPSGGGSAPPARSVDMPVVPASDTVSAAWYCAEGTSDPEGRADETVVVTNVGTKRTSGVVTVLPGGDREPMLRSFTVGPHSQVRFRVADVVEASDPGVVVETFGGGVVVEHELRDGDDVAIGPCSLRSSRRWLFAAGTTVRGVEQYLALFNPYEDDAIVDVSFLTKGGVESPEGLHSVVVARRSRVTVAVHDQVPREEQVAVRVRADVGRVVAEQTLRFVGTDGPTGLAVSLGVTRAARSWTVPVGTSRAGVQETLAIANFGTLATRVEVDIVLDGEVSLEPEIVDLPARSVRVLEPGERAPDDAGFFLEVRADRGAPVVVEARSVRAVPAGATGTAATEPTGVATTMGATVAGRRWAFGTGRPEGGDAELIAVNLTRRPLTVELVAFVPGDRSGPTSTPSQAVQPGERVVFALGDLGVGPDQVVVLRADGAIVTARLVRGPGVSLALGFPLPG